ncbi:MAG: hypothetical protein ACRDJE_02020 [Dehalococcoidia bacterium]
MPSHPNPLTRVARSLPADLGPALAVGGRIAGVAAALALALDQSYDRTRALALALAVITALTLAPLPARLRAQLPWLGAGVLFFGGALLTSFTVGWLILVSGAVAALGATLQEQRSGRPTAVPAFFMGFGMIVLFVAAIVLGIDG